jgi:AraC-like DNA-binding protein
MACPKNYSAHLLEVAAPFVAQNFEIPCIATPVPRLRIWKFTHDTSLLPDVFEPMFYVVLQGTKVLTMGAHRVEVTPGSCASSTFGLPFTYQVTGATPELPYVGISLSVDVKSLNRVMLDMPKRDDSWAPAMVAGAFDGQIGDAFCRLVRLINAPDDIAVLAPHYEAELYYRLLQSVMGDTICQMGDRNERFDKLKKTADWLAANHSEAVVIGDLASVAGMSLTSFHRHFKAVTGYSPLTFQRQMRLREARKLLEAGIDSVAGVAYKVGYVSPSQFSREYKTMFGSSPVADMQ